MEATGGPPTATRLPQRVAFLRQLRARHTDSFHHSRTVIWDNSSAHHGAAIRAYLTTSGLDLRLVNLPSYSPDFTLPVGTLAGGD